MKESIILINNKIREVITHTRIWFIILTCGQIITLLLILHLYSELERSNYHFYMNTKTSLEEINNVKIDAYDGKLKKELSTEDKLIRKNTRHWHLKYFLGDKISHLSSYRIKREHKASTSSPELTTVKSPLLSFPSEISQSRSLYLSAHGGFNLKTIEL